MQCCSSSPTPFTLEYPTTSQAGFPNFQSSLPGHTCSGWPGLSRELSLSSPQLAFTALGCSWDLQSHGCAHRVCSTQPLQKAFGAQHWLRAAAFHTWLTCLQCARALWSPPFVPLSDHSHNLLGVTPEGNAPLGAAGHLCPLGKLTEQSRAEHSTAEILPCSVLRRWRDLETLHSVLCFLLPWIPLDPFCPRSHRQIRALRKLVPASICKKGPFSSPSASCFVEDGWWMHLPCPILYSIHLTLSFIPSQTK